MILPYCFDYTVEVSEPTNYGRKYEHYFLLQLQQRQIRTIKSYLNRLRYA